MSKKSKKISTKKSSTKGRVRKTANYSNVLEAGRHYLQLRKELGINEAVKQANVSRITVYKYMQLAESSERIQKMMDTGRVSSASVLRIFNVVPKKHQDTVGYEFLKKIANKEMSTTNAVKLLHQEFRGKKGFIVPESFPEKIKKGKVSTKTSEAQEDQKLVFPKTRGRQSKIEATLNELHQKLSSRRTSGAANKLLMEFSEKLGKGTKVDSLVQFIRQKDKEMASAS